MLLRFCTRAAVLLRFCTRFYALLRFCTAPALLLRFCAPFSGTDILFREYHEFQQGELCAVFALSRG